MPITHIHKVTATISKAINYGAADKVERDFVKDDIADTIKYAKNDKTGETVFTTLTTYWNSDGMNFTKECHELLEKFPRKREVRDNEEPALLFHLVQGFDGYLPPQLANQIGRELAEEFLKDYKVQISTHTNTENIHNHIIFCAVNLKGERYHDCDETKDMLRKASDAICEKYGLDILDATREYKPIHWRDADGKVHEFEPTARKRELIEKRKNGEISKDDISSYRNFAQYENSKNEKLTHREVVKRDIDTYIPLANDYENLLFLLRSNLGYKIKDKKKNGDYLEHIAFCNPNYSKSVRDSSLGDGKYYSRVNLEKVIETNLIQKQISINEPAGKFVSNEKASKDKYKDFDFNAIDINRRAWKKKDGTVVILKRGEPEKALINSAKKCKRDSEIQERLNALHFVEANNLYDYGKINSMMKNFWENYNSSYEKLNEAGKKLESMKFLVGLPDMIEQIQKRIDAHKDDTLYKENELQHDKAVLEKYKSYLYSKNLSRNSAAYEKLKNDYSNYSKAYEKLLAQLAVKKEKLISYQHAIEILRESSKGEKEEFAQAWKKYDQIKSEGENEEKNNDANRRKRSRDRER